MKLRERLPDTGLRMAAPYGWSDQARSAKPCARP